MAELAEKEQLLRKAGYWYEPDREVYINRRARKVFSIDFLEDHDAKEIASKIREAASGTEWTFVFNDAPSNSVKRELAKMFDA